MDYYKILNLKENASLKEIEQAYLDLANFYNPENNASKQAYKRYRQINKAYLVLKEIKQRELYNLISKEEIKKEMKKEGEKINFNEYKLSDYKQELVPIEEFKDEAISDPYGGYLKLEFRVSYLLYLLEGEYSFTYFKKVIVKESGTCLECLGIGKVRKGNEVIECPSCFGKGSNVVTKKEEKTLTITVSEDYVNHEERLIVNFNFFDKDEYLVKDNVIEIKHPVSEEEYLNGVKYHVVSKGKELLIEENEFKELKKSYQFFDKTINIEYLLTSYKGKDKKGIIVSDKECIYLDLNDFSYTYTQDEKHHFKLLLNESIIVIKEKGEKGYNNVNGDLILQVIKRENESDLRVFFGLQIKKVSANLFKFKGNYNEHYFAKNKSFDYDSEYLYLPNLAYKLKLKDYTLFKIIFISLYLLIPLTFYFIFGVSLLAFILTIVVSFIYLVGVNFLMEVKL